MKTWLAAAQTYVPLILRIALGAVFIVHGWGKISGDLAQLGESFTNMGIPLAVITAWLVAIIEFFGGILVLLGLYTRYAAFFIGLVMIGAMVFVKFSQGFKGGWEFNFVLLMISISLVILGDGPVALRQFFKRGKS